MVMMMMILIVMMMMILMIDGDDDVDDDDDDDDWGEGYHRTVPRSTIVSDDGMKANRSSSDVFHHQIVQSEI